ncbi:hypothetical protein GQ464_014390 [Rhodocaloribacter litoris]|uniref:hypothetical protein n=1 Tax=Rhodocaloribacter litoris TaxID=2558931 RepID=UPI00141EFD33|nr:hypothetical protein [Rhodocaloribacter litoris]QXD14606.1 hypothetical protein GQ464_014390 [Rhodocaloribacter litoris]
MRDFSVRIAAGACLFGLLLAGCDSVPGPPADTRPPLLSGFSFSPQRIVLEELPPGQIEGDLVRVPLELGVTARDEDGDLETVRFLVRPPLSSTEVVAQGEMTAAGDGRYVAGPVLEFSRGEVGVYTVLVFAVDAAGQFSNQARGELVFEAAGRPPVIEDVEMPERVTRPAPGENPLAIPIVAVVSDPDGLENIARVEMQVVPGGAVFRLCDDGGDGACNPGASSGDAVAGDGRFTITVQLTSDNAPGQTTFRFRAVDRAGLESEPVERTITVE